MRSPPRHGTRERLGPLLLATTLSGAAALIYETVWTRSFAIILGSTVQAASATFAAFLVGLAFGAYLFGRRSVPLRRSVHAYVLIEGVIALAAPAIGLLIHHQSERLALITGTELLPRMVVTFTTVLLLVLIPTLLMGGTFPLLLTAARRLGGRLTIIGRLYAFNVLGASLGTAVCGFFLIRLYGVESTLWIAAALNVLSAACAAPLCRRRADPESDLPEEDPNRLAAATPGALPERLLLAIAGASGFMVLGLESVWARLASYFLGNRTYAFTTLLACVLVLLSLGSWLSGRLVARFGRGRSDLFGWTLVASLMGILLSTGGMWLWLHVQEPWERELPALTHLLFLYRALETFILLGPTFIALGALFPMSLMCSRLARHSTGRAAGNYYLANTAGAVAGALLMGFWGMSALGVFGCVAAILVVGAAVALWVFLQGAEGDRRSAPLRGLVGTAVAVLLIALLPNQLVLLRDDEELLYRQEDEYGILQVVRRTDGVIKVTNNRTELIYYLGLASTSYVQQMQGHLGMFYNPDARSALVIGSGYGLTAGALTRYPTLERIDAVEIIPGMIEAADLFYPFHYNYHLDPRVHLVADDGRHYLARSRQKYDVISINVSDPHLPGGSSLFHADFYEIVKRHLAEQGVVIQHAFGSDVELVLRTLLHSFRDVRLLRAYGNGFNVVAAEHPLDAKPLRADAFLQVPDVRSSLEQIGMLAPVTPELLMRGALNREDAERIVDLKGPIATDDRPLLEFAWSQNQALLLFSNE